MASDKGFLYYWPLTQYQGFGQILETIFGGVGGGVSSGLNQGLKQGIFFNSGLKQGNNLFLGGLKADYKRTDIFWGWTENLQFVLFLGMPDFRSTFGRVSVPFSVHLGGVFGPPSVPISVLISVPLSVPLPIPFSVPPWVSPGSFP